MRRTGAVVILVTYPASLGGAQHAPFRIEEVAWFVGDIEGLPKLENVISSLSQGVPANTPSGSKWTQNVLQNGIYRNTAE